MDLLHSEIAGSVNFLGHEKDPKYWLLRQKEDKRLLEACRTFITRMSPTKEIMTKSTADWFAHMYVAAAVLIQEFFMDQAKKVCPSFPNTYLDFFKKTMGCMTTPCNYMEQLLHNQPKEYIILCLDKKTNVDIEFSKRANDIYYGGEKLPDEQYARLEMLKQKVEARIKEEIFDPIENYALLARSLGEDVVDELQYHQTSDSSLSDSSLDSEDDENKNSTSQSTQSNVVADSVDKKIQ